MNKRIYISLGALVIVGIVIAGTLLNRQQKLAASDKADRAFLQQMTAHHMDAIEMANLAKQKAQSISVKALANGILVAQEKESTQMQSWYKNWYGVEMPAMAAMSGMMSDGMDMSKLRSTADFDLEFVSQMIPHHQSAVKMATDILHTSRHREIKTLAANIISSQTAEIGQMQLLKKNYETYPLGTNGRKVLNCGDDTPGSGC